MAVNWRSGESSLGLDDSWTYARARFGFDISPDFRRSQQGLEPMVGLPVLDGVHRLCLVDHSGRMTQIKPPPENPGRVWMPPVLQGDILTFLGLVLLSVVCQASGRGLNVPRGRYAVRRTGATSVQRAWVARVPGLVCLILNIEVLAA